MRLLSTLTLAFMAFLSCGSGAGRELGVPFPVERVLAETETTPVIVITVDGAMWQDVYGPRGRELMPHLWAQAQAHGVALGAPGHGERVAASGPNFVSLPGYTELFEGRTHTGCGDNFCEGATVPTLADEIRAQHTSPSSVAVITSWERIAWAATLADSQIVMTAGSVDSQGDERYLNDDPATHIAYATGREAHAFPGHADYRPDRFTSQLALKYLHAHRPDFLFVGLGDTDEYAHRNDRAHYEQALREADGFIGLVFDELSQMGARGAKTLVIVTADHGRANSFRDHGSAWPESSRIWMFALGGPAATGGFAEAPVPRHLADVAPTIRRVVGLPPRSTSDGHVMEELLAR